MKIAIGYNIKSDSWGGGNQFATYLVNQCKKIGHQITFNLKDKDIDIILLTDPRSFNETISYGPFEILYYLLFKNKNSIVVHRINECDERKKTFHMNKLLKYSNYFADHTIFISNWLKSLDIYQKGIPNTVILNGADENIFLEANNYKWNKKDRLKIVTHHWSANKMKGFDVYAKLDNLLLSKYWSDKIEFTYIGNLPKGFSFKEWKDFRHRTIETSCISFGFIK